MSPDLDDALVRDFPALYRERHGDSSETRMCDGFPGDGWEELIRRMSEKLEPLCTGTDLRCTQIKEKLGTVRVYVQSIAPIPDEALVAVAAAVEESRRTCEGCGAAGQLRKLRWVRTLCADCATFAAEFDRRRFGATPADEEWRDQFRGQSGRVLHFEDALRRWRSRAGVMRQMDRVEGTIQFGSAAYQYVGWTEKGRWTVRCPSVRGVYGVGGTRDQAVADLGEALAELASYLDEIGESLPPSGVR